MVHGPAAFGNIVKKLSGKSHRLSQVHGHYDGRREQPGRQILRDSGIMESLRQIPGGGRMALKYTEEKLNSFDKETLIQLFLPQ